jgi:hypothetical protein
VAPRDTLFRHRVSTQVWVPGPPPVTVPPVPQYRDWGVRILTFSATAFGVDSMFGSPPASLFVTFTSQGGAAAAIFAAGGVQEGANAYVHYSTTPPTTTTPPQTTTTVAPTTTTLTRPAPFASYPNYLRSQKLKNDGAVAQCLMPGGSSIQSFAAACDSVTALLASVWDAAAQGYLVKQGGTCLQVDYNAPDPQVLLPGGAPAAKVGWVTCASTGPGAVWVPTIVETDASGASWYQLIPNARPGVPTPCLNLNLGASQSTQMLVEYNCQGGTHTEERWAPNESFWTALGGTGGTGGTPTTTSPATVTTTPGTPAGAHLLEDGRITPFEVVSDLRCMLVAADGFISVGTPSEECEIFKPSLIAGGFQFRKFGGADECMALAGYSVSIAPCSAATVWTDNPGADPVTKRFPIRPAADLSACLTVNAAGLLFLAQSCSSPTLDQLWYDATNGPPSSLQSIVELRIRNQRTIEDTKPPSLTPSESSLWDQVADAANGPLAAGIFADVFRAFKPGCVSTCIGYVFQFLNFAHWSVQKDIASKVLNSEVECPVGQGTRLRIDVCTVGLTEIAEVKPDNPFSLIAGQLQLGGYLATLARASVTSSLASAPPWPSLGTIYGGIATITYRYVGAGVYGYSVISIPALAAFLAYVAGRTYRNVAKDNNRLQLPFSVISAATPALMVSAMVQLGYNTWQITAAVLGKFGELLPASSIQTAAVVTGAGALMIILFILLLPVGA